MTASELVTAFIKAIEDGDLEHALGMLDEHVTYDNVPMGAVEGPAAVRGVLEPFLAGFDAVEWVVHHQIADDDVVMNERVDRFHRADGGWLELPVAGLFIVREGRIVLWRDYFDRDMLLRQLAPPPPPAS